MLRKDWFEGLQTEGECPVLAKRSVVADDSEQRHSAIGSALRLLRGNRSLRQVHTDTGITYSYLSNIECGSKRPGGKVLSRLADYHNVPLGELLELAGFNKGVDADHDFSNADIRRSYQFVLDDPSLIGCPKPTEDVAIETQRFVVQLYEHFTGKRLLE